MNYAGIYPLCRGSSSYRGRGGKGKQLEILAQQGKHRLIAADLSHDKEYQKFLKYKKQN